MKLLGGKIAFVTGGSRGIGRACALALAEAGADVAINYLSNSQAAEEVCAAISKLGQKARAYQADVSKEEEAHNMIERARQDLGQISILVNNAGITRDTLAMRMKDDQWDAVIGINLKGTFLFTRAAIKPLLKRRRGRIINIASVSGLMGNPGQANYSASKAGVIGLTRTVAKEVASRGITVNAVAPGFIGTDMAHALGDEIIEQIKKNTPLGRLGDPQDVADAVLFLASEGAGFITGHVLTVDGGLTG